MWLAPALSILLLASSVSLIGQTQLRPEQIKDAFQVLPCGYVASSMRTQISGCNIAGGRVKRPWDSKVYGIPSENGLPTVCVLAFSNHPTYAGTDTLSVAAIFVVFGYACYTQAGLMTLLQDHLWLSWWNSQP